VPRWGDSALCVVGRVGACPRHLGRLRDDAGGTHRHRMSLCLLACHLGLPDFGWCYVLGCSSPHLIPGIWSLSDEGWSGGLCVCRGPELVQASPPHLPSVGLAQLLSLFSDGETESHSTLTFVQGIQLVLYTPSWARRGRAAGLGRSCPSTRGSQHGWGQSWITVCPASGMAALPLPDPAFPWAPSCGWLGRAGPGCAVPCRAVLCGAVRCCAG
jgi:hypothetical protein